MEKSLNPNIISCDGKGHIENLVVNGIFEDKVTQWIEDSKTEPLMKGSILNIARKVSESRKEPALLEEIEHRLGLHVSKK